MWYASTVAEIRGIVQWLEGTDEAGWPDQTELALEALRDVERMAAPKQGPDKGPVEIVPGDPKMQRAHPHVRDMANAMRRRNRKRALEAGRAATEQL